MASVGETEFLDTAAVFLGAAVVAVPIFKRLGLGSVIGYLAAGAAIGPFGLRLVPDVETVVGIAEFGVVLLLFVIGLELRPARLWRLRMEIFGLGLLQVAVTAAALYAILLGIGFGGAAGVITALALALSSTAFGVQILREKGDMGAPYGTRAFSILLFQDIFIVPLLALVAFLSPGAAGEPLDWTAAAAALGAVAALVAVGRFGLRPLFVLVARAKADEVFTASALLVVVGSALLMHAVGLSMAMGAFIAGVLMAETEFRHQLETDIEPFRGLLLGLFFMSFGMTVDWSLVADEILLVIGGALGLFALKAAILAGLARAMGSGGSDALRIGATLGQGGEFGFVVFAAAAGTGLLGGEARSILSAIVTISMLATPFAIRAAERALPKAKEDADDDLQHLKGSKVAPKSRIIVAGFGRVGQVVARVMRLRGYDVTLIDNAPRRIRMAATFGNQVYYGDATRLDVLRSAGAEAADIVFLCIDDRDGARDAVERIRERFPKTAIFADTYDRFSEWELRQAGAHDVVRETFESAIELARRGLRHLGDGDAAEELIEEFRRRDAELARLQNEYGAHAGLAKLREKYSLEAPG
ncbi:MAG: monovalent cation:proton antiporter-2 (CPA2) family protein [Paracoccaceae bacterium]